MVNYNIRIMFSSFNNKESKKMPLRNFFKLKITNLDDEIPGIYYSFSFNVMLKPAFMQPYKIMLRAGTEKSINKCFLQL